MTQQEGSRQVTVEKKFIFSRSEADIQAHYKITNDSKFPLSLWWGVEFNFTLLAGDAEDRYYICPGHSLESTRLISEGALDDVEILPCGTTGTSFNCRFLFRPPFHCGGFP